MRNLKFILTALLATPLLLLGGCGDDNDSTGGEGPVLGKTKVDITTTIATRATDNAWENGDEIGIYMMEDNQPVSTTNIYSNKRYVTTATTATGAFAPPAGDDPMYFPTENASVGFVAYYPYSSTVGAANTVAIDVETQTDLPAIDFMVASRVTASEDSPTVNLDFHHRLSKLIIEVENASEVPATALNVTLIGLKTTSSYSISNDALTDDPASVKDIAVTMVQDGTDADLFKGTAIILPAGTVSASINFEFPGGNSYTWNFDSSQIFEKEKRYTFQFKLNKDDVVLTSPDVGGTVNDWVDGVGEGPIDLTPSGTGTQSSPFSISEAKNNIGASDKWVKGFIIRVADNSIASITRGVAAADVRFLIGEKASETDQSKMALVKITDDDIAAWYDFTANGTELVGTAVKVVGTFVTGTSVALIVDNVTENVGGIDPGTGGDDKMTIAEVRALHTGTTVTIDAPNAYIEGIVVSGTNSTSKKNLTIDDGAGGIAIRFVDDAADGYPQGTKMKVMIDGVELSRYNNNSVLQLNNTTNDKASLVEGGVMPAAVEITPAQLMTGDYESRYVAVTGVQFDSQYTNKPIGNASAHASSTAGDNSSNNFTVFVARFSDFVTTVTPSGNGTLKGVAGFNANAIQMLPQVASDLSGLTGNRFGTLAFTSADVSPESINAGTALADAKIVVDYADQPVAGAITYSVTSPASWFTDLTGQSATLVQGGGSFEIPISGTPDTAGDVVFTITSGAITVNATLTVNPEGTTTVTVWDDDFSNVSGTAAITTLSGSKAEFSNAYTLGGTVYANNGSLKFGSGGATGTITTPTLSKITDTKNLKVTFNADAWQAKNGQILKITVNGGGTASTDTIALTSNATGTSGTIVMSGTSYDFTVSDATAATTITFELSNPTVDKRFLLDNLLIVTQ